MLGLILYLEEKDQTFQPQSSQEHRRSTRVCRLPAYLNDFRVGGGELCEYPPQYYSMFSLLLSLYTLKNVICS